MWQGSLRPTSRQSSDYDARPISSSNHTRPMSAKHLPISRSQMFPEHFVRFRPCLGITQEPVPVAPYLPFIFVQYPCKVRNPLVRPLGHGLVYWDADIEIVRDAHRWLQKLLD